MSREVTRVAAREAAHGAFVCGRFWALMEDDEEEDAPDPLPDEVLETPSPSTMAEAFRTTRDLHGKQRKGRKVRMAEIGERLDRVCSRVPASGGEETIEMGDRVGYGRGGGGGLGGGGGGSGGFDGQQARPPPPRPNQNFQGNQGNRSYPRNPNYLGKNFIPNFNQKQNQSNFSQGSGYKYNQYQQQKKSGNQVQNNQDRQAQSNQNKQNSCAGGQIAQQKEPQTSMVASKSGGRSGTGTASTVSKAIAPQDGTVSTNASATKLQCFRCWNHRDHITKDCKKKPVATFVGVGGVGLGCFVAEHTKESKSSDKKAAIALIKIKDHQEEEITKEMVEHGLAHTYPWRWVWKARGVATGAFLVAFQSAAKIEKDAIYDWVPLRKINIMVNVKLWTDESLAAGEMTTVWVTAKGVPKTLKNFHGLCEVGSTLGQFIEADMQLLKSSGQVRLKVGVLDHLRIPGWTKLSTPSLHFYKIYFQLEEVVELGWARSEEDMLQDFEDIMDSQPEVNSERDPKRQKNSENAPPTPTGDSIRGGKEIVASTRTLLALEQREKDLMEQDEADAMLSKKLAEQRKHQLDANQIKKKRQDDDGEDSFVSDRYDKDLGYSDADMLNLS
ncbi:hypothetical protein ACQ4PT_023975 [Festuca glaucescens]